MGNFVKESDVNIRLIGDILEKDGICITYKDGDGPYIELSEGGGEPAFLWLNERSKMLYMRAIVMPREQWTKILSNNEVDEWAAQYNQNRLGTIDVRNGLGIVVDYPLPYHGGLVLEAMFQATKLVRAYAKFLRDCLSDW